MLLEEGYGLLPIDQIGTPEVLERFSCGKPHLDAFLVDQALAQHADRLGFTCVVFHEDFQEAPVAYYTLANDGIPLKQSEQTELGHREQLSFATFPAVKIGRLAVHHTLHGSGVGSAVMKLIIGEILDNSTQSAARLLVVDADNTPDVIAYYERQGFQNSLWAQDQLQNHGRNKRSGRPATVKMIRDVLAVL